MIKTYLPYEPDQQLLLPAALQECRLMGQRSFSSLVELDRSRPLGPALARSSPDTVKSRTSCG